MRKEELLQLIRCHARESTITKEELIDAYEQGLKSPAAESQTLIQSRLSAILYFIGGLIVVLGIAILIGQNWNSLNAPSKILSTLGSGIAAFVVGVLFSQNKKFDLIGQAFFFISVLVMPTGLSITFDIAGFDIGSNTLQFLTSIILLATFLGAYSIFKKTVLLIACFIFGTWAFFSLTNLIVGNNPIVRDWKFFDYRVLMTGLTYIFLGYYLSENDTENKETLANWLYGLGIIGFLGAALKLGGWPPHQNPFWELVFPGLVFGTIFLSIYLKNKSFLLFGSLYLMAYIGKISAEYFAHSLGWPLALVIAGLALMATGYFSFYLNKKYISA
ncbi:MAG TPA: hypothetical protein PL155_01640 [Candidatus Omnitrophota bacterium]|nr:hypothetical protein [Candidatus Omnitrophota bacterium]HPD84811.1 hypothetical protein [Candidatus Omnitrophota bacterium]HRZ03669.1 hypothetical protein [Candidatus Omnitrophota bacterium]